MKPYDVLGAGLTLPAPGTHQEPVTASVHSLGCILALYLSPLSENLGRRDVSAPSEPNPDLNG